MEENETVIYYDKIIKLHNSFHLGDNIFNICYFNKISSYLKENNIIVFYYLKEKYIQEVLEFLITQYVILIGIENETEIGIHFWIGNKDLLYNIHHQSENNYLSFNDMYVKFFNVFSDMIGIPKYIDTIIYSDEDLLHRYNMLDEKYKNIDVLIINSIPLSGQLLYNEFNWKFLVHIFNKNYNVVTTKKVDNIKCTLDDGLSIKTIGALSIHAKIIISVNTGVTTGILNSYTLNNVKGVFIFDRGCHYNFEKFYNYKTLDEIDIEKVFKLLNS